MENYFSYFSTKTYVVGTKKNRLNETVLFSTQNICLNWWVRKYLQIYEKKIFIHNCKSCFVLGEVGCIQSIRYTCEAPNLVWMAREMYRWCCKFTLFSTLILYARKRVIGFWPSKAQTSLLSYRDLLDYWYFAWIISESLHFYFPDSKYSE